MSTNRNLSLIVGIVILLGVSLACNIPSASRQTPTVSIPVRPTSVTTLAVASPLSPTVRSTAAKSAAAPTQGLPTQKLPTQVKQSQVPTQKSGSAASFPLPTNVQNVMATEQMVNFQTAMGLKDIMTFYREAFGKLGYKERTNLTVTTDTTFNLVFDGAPNGLAVVIQGVTLGPGSSNVNIRYEKV